MTFSWKMFEPEMMGFDVEGWGGFSRFVHISKTSGISRGQCDHVWLSGIRESSIPGGERGGESAHVGPSNLIVFDNPREPWRTLSRLAMRARNRPNVFVLS